MHRKRSALWQLWRRGRLDRTRVLIVDDDLDAVATLVALLETDGCNAKGIYSARSIVAVVREFDPAVIIIDIAMPGRSGWDAARDIRQDKPRNRPMLIAVTGQYPKDGDTILAEIDGYDYYLVKPFDPNALLQLIGEHRSAI
jgi:DNA-binding response OmpR family regulator